MENKVMRYIKIEGGTGYCGQDFEEYLYTDMSDKELDELYAEKARDNEENEEQYEYEVSVEEAEQMMKDYYADTYAYWEEITKEEYEGNKNE